MLSDVAHAVANKLKSALFSQITAARCDFISLIIGFEQIQNTTTPEYIHDRTDKK